MNYSMTGAEVILRAALISTVQLYVYRGGKDKNSTFLGRMDFSGTRRLLILRPVSF